MSCLPGAITGVAGKMFKAKFYCEVCQKQMKDQNGMNCHLHSESHKEQMRVYAANPMKFLEQNSQEFQSNFLNILRQRPEGQSYPVNAIYNEILREKGAVRLSSTRWSQMQSFLEELQGKDVLEFYEDPSLGLIVKLSVSASGAHNAAKAKQSLVRKAEGLSASEIAAMEYLKQEQKAKEASIKFSLAQKAIQELGVDKLQEEKSDEYSVGEAGEEPDLKFQLVSNPQGESLGKRQVPDDVFKAATSSAKLLSEQKDDPETNGKAQKKLRVEALKDMLALTAQIDKPVNALRQPSQSEQSKWICKGIVVQINDNDLGGGMYFGLKGRVRRVAEDLWAEVEELKSLDVLRIHQELLKTVVPNIGRDVVILKSGEYRKATGKLVAFDKSTKEGKVEVVDTFTSQKVQIPVRYGEFSKKYVKDDK